MRDYFNLFTEENIDLLVWHKTNPIPAIANNYLSDLEYCFFAREKGVEVHCNYESSSKLYESAMNKKDKEKYKHPTIKPLPLIKKLIIKHHLIKITLQVHLQLLQNLLEEIILTHQVVTLVVEQLTQINAKVHLTI